MALYNRTNDYFKYGNLHPLQYIKRCSKKAQKVVLFATLFALLAFGIYIIMIQWNSYQENMVERYLDTVSYPIWDLYFPAVTICSYNVVYKKRAKDVSNFLSEQILYMQECSKIIFLKFADTTKATTETPSTISFQI